MNIFDFNFLILKTIEKHDFTTKNNKETSNLVIGLYFLPI